MQYKYMAAFFYGVSLYTGELVAIGDEDFNQMLQGFIMNYYPTHYKLINKIFDVRYTKEKGYFYRIDYNKILKYGTLLWTNPKEFNKMYDEIGWENIEEISDLAWLFGRYQEEITDLNNSKRIKH